jgi:site-specific recombinase XerD
MTDTTPMTIIRTLRRLLNAEYRPREYLTEGEVEKLIDAARRRGRNGARDSAAILLAYRHGLRAKELFAPCHSEMSARGLRHGTPRTVRSAHHKRERLSDASRPSLKLNRFEARMRAARSPNAGAPLNHPSPSPLSNRDSKLARGSGTN